MEYDLNNNQEEQIQEKQAAENEEIENTGTLRLGKEKGRHNIQLITIIGEIEGHEAVSGNVKATMWAPIWLGA